MSVSNTGDRLARPDVKSGNREVQDMMSDVTVASYLIAAYYAGYETCRISLVNCGRIP